MLVAGIAKSSIAFNFFKSNAGMLVFCLLIRWLPRDRKSIQRRQFPMTYILQLAQMIEINIEHHYQ